MFGADQKEEGQKQSAETFIGPSVKLEGNFAADGDVVVDGILVGTLTTQGDIRIGPQANIEATVRAKNASVAGKVKGNLQIDNSLKLSASANIHGDIKTASISVEDGAVINGKVNMRQDKNMNSPSDSVALDKDEKVTSEKAVKKMR
jgi:cytoskeletal protein CcmA (bactofilin family)